MLTSIINLSLPVDDPNRLIEIQGYQAESYIETPSQPNFEPIEIPGRSSPITFYTGGSARTVSFSMFFHRDMIAPPASPNIYAYHPAGIETQGSVYSSSNYAGLFLDPNGTNKDGSVPQELVNEFIENWREDAKASHYGSEMVDYMDRTIGKDSYDDYIYANFLRDVDNLEAKATANFHLFLNKIKALNYPVYSPNGVTPPMVYLKIGGHEGLGGIRLKGYCTTTINYDGIVKHNSLISTSVDFSFTEVVDIAWSAPEVIGNMERYVKYMDPKLR